MIVVAAVAVCASGGTPAQAQADAEPAPTEQAAVAGAAEGSGEPAASHGASSFDLRRGAHEFGVLGGGAFSVIAMGGLEKEDVRGRHVALLALRYGRTLLRRDSFALQYFADLVPVAVETNTILEEDDGFGGGVRKTAYGAGIAPLGARLVFRPAARFKPFISASGGILLLSEEVPLPGARRYAFTGDIEAGIQYWPAQHHSFNGGVRFHHISNANTGDTNPGLNAIVFFLGFSVHR